MLKALRDGVRQHITSIHTVLKGVQGNDDRFPQKHFTAISLVSLGDLLDALQRSVREFVALPASQHMQEFRAKPHKVQHLI